VTNIVSLVESLRVMKEHTSEPLLKGKAQKG